MQGGPQARPVFRACFGWSSQRFRFRLRNGQEDRKFPFLPVLFDEGRSHLCRYAQSMDRTSSPA